MPPSFLYLTMLSLELLPIEIICHILDNLNMHDLLACSLVSKHIRRVIAQSSRLQYSIELQKARMVSILPPSSSSPFASRLKLLRERECNWRYINWAKRHTLSLPPTGSVYEFVGGIYGNGREDDSRVTASISFLELPSTDASFLNEPKETLQAWTHCMGDVNIIDFTMDPSQDLLVLVALAPPEAKHVYELHLRSIKTNKPHHKAPLHILPCWLKSPAPVQTSDVVAAVRVQVCGNLVALLIKEIQEGTGAHLEIWNWETHPQYSCALTRNSGIDDFTFLTHDTFLLVRPAGRFEVYTFVDPSSLQRSTAPVLRVMYTFPRLSPGYMYWYISMSSNPAPGYVPHAREQDPEIGNKYQMYYPRPEERIHACCLYIFNPANEENTQVYSFVFFLNLQTLLNPPTEWIEKTRASNTSKSKASNRLQDSTAHIDASPGATLPPVASSSSSTSSSPISSDVAARRSPPTFTKSTETTPPFIPPFYEDEENVRHSPQYPLFPTFDDSMQNSTRRIPHRKPLNPKPQHPPRKQRVRTATSSLASIPPNTEIPWDVWGPSSTRWFEECLSTDWQHAIYGLRTVESINPNHGANRSATINTNPNPPPQTAVPGAWPNTSTSNDHSTAVPGAWPSMSMLNDHTTVVTSSNEVGAEDIGSSSSSSGAPAPGQQVPSLHSSSQAAPTSVVGATGGGSIEQGEGAFPDGANASNDHAGAGDAVTPLTHTRRRLRVRDFNPYSFTENAGAFVALRGEGGATEWRAPRLVTELSMTPVQGVFTEDIVSALPYMEIVSREKFDVTDVMLDDCRVLLLKRGQTGKLERVEVLMM